MKHVHYVTLTMAAAVLACGPALQQAATPSSETKLPLSETETAVYQGITETLTASANPTTTVPEEAILILTPANSSRLVGQVHVEGIADSTFEQTLVLAVVLLGEPERMLAQQPVIIQAELGQRGPFAADVAFTYSGPADQPGEIRVYASSPRDGGITHLASAQVMLAASGAPDIRTADPHSELIAISSPSPGGTIRGGVAHVEGIGLASFEQTLVVEVYDQDGRLAGSSPVTVEAPDYGVRGPFTVDVPYTISVAGAGRIVVRDPSPAFGQMLHLASVEVRIEP